MIDSEVALNTVVTTVRIVGNLYPIEKNPIRTQDKLGNLRIKDDKRVEAIRVRIIEKLPKLKPPFELNKEHLRNVDTSTEVGTIVGIVINKSQKVVGINL